MANNPDPPSGPVTPPPNQACLNPPTLQIDPTNQAQIDLAQEHIMALLMRRDELFVRYITEPAQATQQACSVEMQRLNAAITRIKQLFNL